MNEFLEQFLIESRELAEQATAELLALEQSPDDREHLDGAFRAFHTLKGGAGIIDFLAMSRLVHGAEEVLSAVRSGERQITPRLVGGCLMVVDRVVQWLDEIQTMGDLPAQADAEAVIARLGFDAPAMQTGTAAAPESEHRSDDLSSSATRILDEQLLLLTVSDLQGREGRIGSAARVAISVLDHLGFDAQARRVAEAGHDPARVAQAITAALEMAAPATPAAAQTASPTLRVDAARIDALVNLTGELIVAKNGLAHLARQAEAGGDRIAEPLREAHARFERLLDGLRHAVLGLRMLPFRGVFRRFLRVVRELAVELDKPTNLVVEGEDTEADKAVVERLFEPLLHAVRNAVDHGIETAAERAAAGKPAVATIALRAARRGEHVVVEVSDDGRGIDADAVRRSAAARGIAHVETLAGLSDQDAIDLIFTPGFSTASGVTSLSGRGVGLDSVRTVIERLGGRATMNSHVGRGTTLRFTLPFSVMMTRVMTVEAGGQMFGIPLDAVLETVRLPRDCIKLIGMAGAFVLRDRTVPLINLAQTLGKAAVESLGPEALAVIASVRGQIGALEVDRLGARMDVVLKPAEGLLQGVSGIAGTTLTGDGQVLIVLDLQELLG